MASTDGISDSAAKTGRKAVTQKKKDGAGSPGDDDHDA